MRVQLLAPADGSPGSGAATYNRCMIDALREVGHTADLIGLHGRYPAAAADAADLLALRSLPRDAHTVLDGLALGAWRAAPHIDAALIHQPSALFGLAGGPDRAALEAAERVALASLPRLIVTSAEVAGRLEHQYGVAGARIAVVPPGVDELPRNYPGAGPCRILSLGPLVPRREHELLLAALARLADLDWRLVLAGSQRRDPAHAASLRASSAAPPFAGRVDLTDTGSAIAWAETDLLVLAHPVPSLDGAIMQALRRGIPVVLCSEAASPSLEGAVVCPPRDPEQVSKVLRRLIFDVALRRRMGEAAWRTGQALPGWPARAVAFAAALARSTAPGPQPRVTCPGA